MDNPATRIFAVILAAAIAGPSAASAQDVTGKWQTIDDETDKPRSIVEIFEKSGKLYGKVIKLFRESDEEPDPVCKDCDEDDNRYNKKVIGMEIMRDMVKTGDAWEEGTILDPKNGKVYRCRIWLEGTDMKVRGYWGPFYRTQTWHRPQ
ncbi:MAG TPA: DUF2147 domain-containing protein [Cyclobacteriaceae bacterium]|nr:DUF2147 domain-containing protein [Cyclobacteriaceae bacterium]